MSNSAQFVKDIPLKVTDKVSALMKLPFYCGNRTIKYCDWCCEGNTKRVTGGVVGKGANS